MTYYSMMKQGAKIRIEAGRNKGYAPSEFWTESGVIYCNTPILGSRARRDDLTAARINAHIANMMKEGFNVSILYC